MLLPNRPPKIPHALFPTFTSNRVIDLSKITSLESDPLHLPNRDLDYSAVPDGDVLPGLTTAFNNHGDAVEMCRELNCNTVTFTGALPHGFTAWRAARGDMYIYGHHENTRNHYPRDKIFRSVTQFAKHVFWIVTDQVVAGNLPRGCRCAVCVG